MRKILLTLAACLPLLLNAIYMENLPTQVTQPDGTILNLLASGDEFSNRLHDAKGYSIIQSETDGFYYYAQLQNSKIEPSVWRVGSVNPAAKSLVPNLNISENEYKDRVRRWREHDNPAVRTPNTGTVNNICVFIRFSDQTEFPLPRSTYIDKFNAVGDSVNSMRNYFLRASYGQLDIVTGLYPDCPPEINLSYLDTHPRSYYVPFNAFTNPDGYTDYDDRVTREQQMLANAVNSISSQVSSQTNVDADNDGNVDNVCFIVRGPHTAWAELLWGHRWFLFGADASINGKQVGDFTFQMENQNEAYVLCHEMFHSIGSPDLYHYTFNGVSPVGSWDLMESGKGHMGAYMKWIYGGWLPTPQTINQTGLYDINPVTSNTNCLFRLGTNLLSGERIYVEYRKKGSDGFEQNLPESGLIFYRIDPTLVGNSQGPPDEVYIFRPDGSQTVNGEIADAAFCAEKHKTEFNNYTNPASTWPSGSQANMSISNISFCGDSMSFFVTLNPTEYPPNISEIIPQNNTWITPGNYLVRASVGSHGNSISSVNFMLDGIEVTNITQSPYSYNWEVTTSLVGEHTLLVTAYTNTGLESSGVSHFTVIDPQIPSWFSWTSDTPAYEAYGRGSLPIQVAIDLDLGTQDYKVKKLSLNVLDDPYGDPAIPGRITASIQRFTDGAITDTVLIDLGDITIPLNSHQEIEINNANIINGKIALVINLYAYQNIVFDINGVTGHTWLTEPDRPWMDAQGRGMLGAADIGLQLQSPYVGNDENTVLAKENGLLCYPNPCSGQVTLNFNLAKESEISLGVYNLKGQKVRTILTGIQTKGSHSLTWDGFTDMGKVTASGVYLIRLTDAKGLRQIRKIVLAR